ncbi:hypothetical protein D3Y57_07030 [Sphingomonas paeninsulae]|uniref:Portal protein n=1 Tax=Sphingomonas paeninsulae TaxID=2319844 RepID=A0A494TJ22_SPHPE|nr:hypothetical protein [Sphingomonas paeninsulae]AYJ85771.1 hypothetical protein D3Y57_07030 [Sphingomonas paeninsulae]
MLEPTVTGVAESAAPVEADPDKPLAAFDLEDGKFVELVRKWFLEASKKKQPIMRKRKVDHEMYAGKQWSETDTSGPANAKRPRLTINLILTMINAVEGEERTNRQEMKFYGTGGEDDENAANLNRILKWIVKGCGGEFALSQQFRNGAISGEGWVVPEVDFFDDPEGKIKLAFVPDAEMFDDPLSVSPVGDDARRRQRAKQMTEDELEARWPGCAAQLRSNTEGGELGTERDGKGFRDIYLDPADQVNSPKLYNCDTKMWTVLETWWWQIESGWVVINEQTGLMEEKTEEEFSQLQDQRAQDIQNAQVQAINAQLTAAINPPALGQPVMPQPQIPPPLQAKQRPLRKFYQAFTVYDVLLEKKASPMPRLKRIPYIPVRAMFDSTNGEWFGLVRPVTDVQKQHNVEQSTIVALIQLMGKGSWKGPKGSFHNKHEWETKLGQTGQLLEYNAARGEPKPIEVPPIPRHLVDLAMTRPQMIREISGVNVEMTGQRQGSDAGVVMEMRKKAARTSLAPLFDNFRHTKIELGMVLLAYIQTYISVGRMIRVVGPDGAAAVSMTTDMSIGQYDVTVEETDSSVNDRMATLNILQTTLPQVMSAGIPVPPEFIDLLPMPPHVRDAWKRLVLWQMTTAGTLPPPDWKAGDPIPPPPGMPLPPGVVPSGAPAPQPAQ